MIRIGITGQAGFIGTHLYNYLGIKKEEVIRVPFQDDCFSDQKNLELFVKQCDVIVHLAAVNRHNDPQTIYDTNISLVKQLITALDNTGARPHILFSSSTQEDRENVFGRSKREGRRLFIDWSNRTGALFTGMVIPNVFGPFGNPYYNSVVATFAHQLTHDNKPHVETDVQLKLIYIGDLVEVIWYLIKNRIAAEEYKVTPTDEAMVSEIMAVMQSYKEQYLENGIIPDISDAFSRNLFNTFICYMDHLKIFPYKLSVNADERGSFVETVKLHSGGQVSFSITKPGVVRGNHFHTRKAERFVVIKGKALIQLRRIGTDRIMNFELDGIEPAYVDMPVWHTHNITNIGSDDLYTIFWISEFFDSSNPDTFFEKV